MKLNASTRKLAWIGGAVMGLTVGAIFLKPIVFRAVGSWFWDAMDEHQTGLNEGGDVLGRRLPVRPASVR